jgi:hypothetical protein
MPDTSIALTAPPPSRSWPATVRRLLNRCGNDVDLPVGQHRPRACAGVAADD